MFGCKSTRHLCLGSIFLIIVVLAFHSLYKIVVLDGSETNAREMKRWSRSLANKD